MTPQNIDQVAQEQKKHLQKYTCWKCKFSWSDVPLEEDSAVCPSCKSPHGMITTEGKTIPRRRYGNM